MQTHRTQKNGYDVIVIGARCAGSPTAMLLARQGYRVLLVEKASFPSDVPRGHVIQASGVAQLKEWGLLEQILASNCQPVSRLVFDLGPVRLEGMPEGASIIAPRHGVLDAILAQAAVEACAEFRQRFLVQEILMDGEHVRGIRGHGADGIEVTEEATLVVGADGLHSLVAQAVQAPVYTTKPPLTCAYFTYYQDLPTEEVSLYVRGNRFIVVFPTNDQQTCIGIQFPREELHSFRANLADNFLTTLDLVPGLLQRVRQARQTERLLGATDLPNFFRKPYGPGWALVGDAGYHKDPYTAQGISDAFSSAQLLTDAIDAGFRGNLPLEQALADYEQQRNAHALPRYEFNAQLASFAPPPPEMLALFGALQTNQTETNHFFGALTGVIPLTEFLAPDNIQRIVAQSLREPSGQLTR